MESTTLLFIATGIITSLIAGLLFSFSVGINGALHTLDDEAYTKAMAAINNTLEKSGLFMSFFMAPVILLPLTALSMKGVGETEFYLMTAAAILYIVGVFGVTVAKNVPLNKKLRAFVLGASLLSDYEKERKNYEAPWTRAHGVRSFTAFIVTVLIFVTLAI